MLKNISYLCLASKSGSYFHVEKRDGDNFDLFADTLGSIFTCKGWFKAFKLAVFWFSFLNIR